MNEETKKLVESLIYVIRDISFGSGDGFGALESIAVALAGKGLENPIGESINNIADAINNHSESIRSLVNVIEEKM